MKKTKMLRITCKRKLNGAQAIISVFFFIKFHEKSMKDKINDDN